MMNFQLRLSKTVRVFWCWEFCNEQFSLLFQLNVFAVDQGVPPRRSGPRAVTITVIRNRNSPEFQNEPYTKNINQNAQPNSNVLTVRARDTDTRVSKTLPSSVSESM